MYLAAVAAGIAAAVRDDAVWYVRNKARPAAHSLAESAAADPFTLQAVGEIAASASAAEALVLNAADAIDHLVDSGRQNDADQLAQVHSCDLHALRLLARGTAVQHPIRRTSPQRSGALPDRARL